MSKFLTLNMFILSFSPLWLSVIFVDFKSIFIEKNQNIITEIVFLVTIVLLWIISFISLYFNLHITQNNSKDTFILNDAKECKTITTDFFLSYILPLFAFDFTQWDGAFEFLIFFFVLAFLCIRHNNFSVNIILELMGYKMYECFLLNPDGKEIEKIVISKDSLSVCKGKEITVNHLNNDFVQMIDIC